jgi:hypothetical protein
VSSDVIWVRVILFSKPVPADQCLPYLGGGHIDLISRDRRVDALEPTGVHAALLPPVHK